MTDTHDPYKWNKRFIRLAEHIASWSKDPSTKVGCVVVGPDREIRSTGYNGFPRGIHDDDRLNNRESKYPIIVHAEENAIAQAARIGVSLKGCAIFIWPFPPCSRCARTLIQAGVSLVVYPETEIPDRWQADVDRALSLLGEANVIAHSIDMEAKCL